MRKKEETERVKSTFLDGSREENRRLKDFLSEKGGRCAPAFEVGLIPAAPRYRQKREEILK